MTILEALGFIATLGAGVFGIVLVCIGVVLMIDGLLALVERLMNKFGRRP